MSSANITQLMSDLRQLVISLQKCERATDSALSKSQLVSEKITGMKEYQEEISNLNDCWRMQGRRMLVAGLQQENRQILQLQQENRELRQTLEECENTLQLIMQKHRAIVLLQKSTPVVPEATSKATYDQQTNQLRAIIAGLTSLLDDCFKKGEEKSRQDQEIIAQLIVENACLRELLNISTLNEPGITQQFLKNSANKVDYLISSESFSEEGHSLVPGTSKSISESCSKNGDRGSITLDSKSKPAGGLLKRGDRNFDEF